MTNNKPALLSKPVTIFHRGLRHAPETLLVIERKATAEVTCKVMVAIAKKCQAGVDCFVVTVAVQYADGQAWYRKEVASRLSLPVALHAADGFVRKYYKNTASRALAGLLHDSVVPATEDLMC